MSQSILDKFRLWIEEDAAEKNWSYLPFKSDTVESGERNKKTLGEVCCSEIDHKEMVGIGNIFAILSSIVDCSEVARKADSWT